MLLALTCPRGEFRHRLLSRCQNLGLSWTIGCSATASTPQRYEVAASDLDFIARRTPKCREVVKLLSQSMEAKLPFTTRIKIRFHYLICIWCYRYGKQLHALRKIASSLPEHVDDCSRETLPDSSKERMRQVLRETRRE